MARILDRAVVLLLAALGLAGVTSVAIRWGARPEYADRFLILLAAIWAAVRAWPTVPSHPTAATRAIGIGFVLSGAIAFPITWLLQVQIGPRTLLLWWQAGAVVLAAMGTILVRDGWLKVRACGFALLFPFLALPIPDRFLVPLQSSLQLITTRASQLLLAVLYPVQRTGTGFILELPGGPLEVAEACSGVRSLTALVAIAAFVAFLRGFGPFGGALLLGCSIPVVALTNILRVFLSGIIQETFGTKYIQGDWHEALGFVMVLVGLAGILTLASVFHRLATPWETTPRPAAPPPAESPRRFEYVQLVVAGLLFASTLGTGYAIRLGWLAVSERLAIVPLERLPLQIVGWQSKGDEPMPKVAAELLVPDVGQYRIYTDNIGREAHVWVMYWSSLSAVRGYHHPDVCWSNRGGVQTLAETVLVEPSSGGRLPLTTRRYDVGSNQQHFVLYWTQEGRNVWDSQAEADAVGQGLRGESGTAWVADLLKPQAARPPGRLTVVVVTRHTGPAAEREVVELARQFSDELYQLCPWAAPPQPLSERHTEKK